MRKTIIFLTIFCFGIAVMAAAKDKYEVDTFQTSADELKIFFLGHSTLYFEFGDMIIHVDPVYDYANYKEMPKADLILVTHEHGDHLDETAIKDITKNNTVLILTERCQETVKNGQVMKNGDTQTVHGIKIEAIPAYNIVHMIQGDIPFHPKGVGNGYILTFGDKRVYVAGDTENTPEMKALTNIDIAFLPMNLPYTMSPEMVADAAKAFRPDILYPYHFGNTDTSKLVELLKDETDIEVRIRDMN
jgi:L-ascorbate metabolism protein UlaG (beta-lactamase superfamily)